MIRNIITENFMGAVGRVITNVQKFTAFVGSNGAGKSTRLDSVMVTIQGYISEEQGRKPIKTMEMARDDNMICGVELDNDRRYERVFNRKGKSVSTLTRIDGEEVPMREGSGIIENDLGNLPVMFDLGEFNNKSPEKKKEFLFGISNKITDISDEKKFFGSLRYELMKQVIDDVTPDNLLKFKMGVESFSDLSTDQYDEYFGVLNGQIDGDISDYIDAVLVGFKERFTASPQVLFETLSKMVSEEVTYLKRVVRDTDATRSKLAGISANLDGQKQELKTIKDDISYQQKRKDKIINDISANKSNVLRVQDHENLTARLKEKIEDDQAFLEDNADMSELIDSIDILNADVEAATSTRVSQKESLALTEESYAEKTSEIKSLRQEKASELKLIESLKSVNGHCVISELVKCNEDFSLTIAGCEETLRALEAKIGPLKSETEALSVEIIAYKTTVREGAGIIVEMEDALASSKRDLAVTEERRNAIMGSIDSNKVELEDYGKRELPVITDADILEKQLKASTDALILLDDRKTAINRAEATFLALNDEILKAKSSSDKLMAANGLKKTISELRNQLLSTAVKPLVRSITKLMKKLDPTFEVKFDLEYGFNISVFKDGQWQPFSSLSGGETLLFAVALLTAIIETANPPLKVLALEAAELDKANLKIVMEALPIISDNIDNVLIAYPTSDIEPVDGWMINKL